MPKLPKVSIIIPCYERDESYGQAQYLGAALKSIARQEPPYEVIVVDDSSPLSRRIDDVVYSFTDYRIKYLKNPKNSGTGKARNFAIEQASGEFILPLDGDDTLTPFALELFRKAMKKYPKAVAYGAMTDSTGTHITWAPRTGWTLRQLRENNMIPYCSMFSRAAWAEVGGYNDTRTIFEDWDLWLALANRGYQFINVWQPVVYHRCLVNQQFNWMKRQILENNLESKYTFMDKLSRDILDRPISFPL